VCSAAVAPIADRLGERRTIGLALLVPATDPSTAHFPTRKVGRQLMRYPPASDLQEQAAIKILAVLFGTAVSVALVHGAANRGVNRQQSETATGNKHALDSDILGD
jgi:hypothetical protein